MLNMPYLSPSQLNRQVTQAHEQDFQRLSTELSSGGISEDFTTIENVKQYLDQEVVLQGIQSYQNSNKIAKERMLEASSVMGSFKEVINDFQVEISKTRGNSLITVTNFQTFARDKLIYMNSLLNKTFNGQYIFSGTAIDTPTVKDLENLPSLGLNAVVDSSEYYQGSTNNLISRADDFNTVSLNVTGADKGIAELITALRLCAYFDPSEADARLARATDLCGAASTDIIQSGANLDFQIVVLENVGDSLLALEGRVTENIKELGYRSEIAVFQDFIQAKESLALSRYVTTSALNSIRDLIDRMP